MDTIHRAVPWSMQFVSRARAPALRARASMATHVCGLCAHAGPTPPLRCSRLALAPLLLLTRIPCATSYLLLKHLDAKLATCVRGQMKHLKHASETLSKTFENYCKHTQNPDKTLTTYV
jgi:hypothetical protein